LSNTNSGFVSPQNTATRNQKNQKRQLKDDEEFVPQRKIARYEEDLGSVSEDNQELRKSKKISLSSDSRKKKLSRDGLSETEARGERKSVHSQNTRSTGTTAIFAERFAEATTTIVEAIQECEMILREACKQREENLANARILAQKLGEMTEKKKQNSLLILQLQEEITSLRTQLQNTSSVGKES